MIDPKTLLMTSDQAERQAKYSSTDIAQVKELMTHPSRNDSPLIFRGRKEKSV